MKSQKFAIAALVLVIAAMLVGSVLISATTANAAPLPAPTAVSAPADRAPRARHPITFFSAARTTADGRGTVYSLPDYNVMDLQWVVDVGTVNTTTLKFQFSNDGVNWVDGASIEAGIVADKNSLQQFPIYGRYVSVYADVTNTNPITLTLIGVAK